MNLYEFSWGAGSDEERYSFLADVGREDIVKAMSDFKGCDGDVTNFDEFAAYVYASCEFNIQRYYHEEPTYIHEDELTKY